MSIFLVEQNVAIALEKAEYIYMLERDRIVLEGPKGYVFTKNLMLLKHT